MGEAPHDFQVMHATREAFDRHAPEGPPPDSFQLWFSQGRCTQDLLGICRCLGLELTEPHIIAPLAEAAAVPDDVLSLEELLLLSSDDDEPSDDDDEEEEEELSSLLLLVLLESSDEASEEPAGFLRFFLASDLDPGSSLPFLASPGSSSDAPRKRGLYCRCMPPCQVLSHAKAHIIQEKQVVCNLLLPSLL